MAALFRTPVAMMPLNAATDVDVFVPEDVLAPETPETTVDVDFREALFTPGVHEAVFTILNGTYTKEQVEEVVLARQAHLRNGEDIMVNEHVKDDIIHQQFHTLASVQVVIADLKRRGIEAELKINWGN